MYKKSVLKLLVVAALPLACASAFAATATAPLAVSAAVSKNCSITTTPLVFGNYDPVVANLTAALPGTGTVKVGCAKNSTGLTVGMSAGLWAVGAQRSMKGATSAELLNYDLFLPVSTTADAACASATAWTDASLLVLTTAPSKAIRNYNVCGSIPGGQDPSPDTLYADTVTATINF